jgi:dephospho-CoA kinase
VLLVGLTGGIGSGKSTVASMLAERGAVVIDADVLARDAIAPGTPGFDRVVELFGDDVLSPAGDLDRARIAELVFHDEGKRRALEAIVHPEVARRVAQTAGEHAGTDHVVVLDSPLLIETGAHEACDVVIVVRASAGTQLSRLVEHGMDEADARARIAAQLPTEEKTALADVVIDNEGTLADLAVEVDRVWAELRDAARGRA